MIFGVPPFLVSLHISFSISGLNDTTKAWDVIATQALARCFQQDMRLRHHAAIQHIVLPFIFKVKHHEASKAQINAWLRLHGFPLDFLLSRNGWPHVDMTQNVFSKALLSIRLALLRVQVSWVRLGLFISWPHKSMRWVLPIWTAKETTMQDIRFFGEEEQLIANYRLNNLSIQVLVSKCFKSIDEVGF